MKINLYSESPDPGPGGAEQFIAVLAEALSRAHEVSIVHHKSAAGETAWAEYAGCDLQRVKFRHVPRLADDSDLARTAWARFRRAKAWRRELTSDCDLFIALLHNKPPFCRARRGVLVVLFPTYEPFRELDQPAKPAPKPQKKKKKKPSSATKPRQPQPGREGWFAWQSVRRWYVNWEWRRRLATYDVKLAISDFSREWAQRRWGIATGLLYPPVKMPREEPYPTERRILSVGRFATTGHTKKQLEMLRVFRDLHGAAPDWSYVTVGGLSDFPPDHAYYEEAHSFADGVSLFVEANVSRERLRELYRSARIFWHAAGFGDDIDAQPEMAEHFGLVTVEAMANGCVPVVIRRGGQPEIITHGIDGFLWETLDELKSYTRQLMADAALCEGMASAARVRAEHFSREACVRRLVEAAGLSSIPEA